ncbi:MAG: SCO family protein [Gammaproteobacteria bacterium]|nr:MAG: SCO family protein [Gammaproteobacteria bacterium]
MALARPAATRLLAAVLAVCAAAAGLWLARGGSAPPPVQTATLYPDDFPPVAEFTLYAADGTPWNRDALAGRWSLIFFGFTHCPDVCPMTLHTLAGVWRDLEPEQRERLRVVFVSVDPERDRGARLGEYLAYFSPDFLGLWGEDDALAPLIDSLGAVYHRETAPDGTVTVDHSAGLFLLGPDTRPRAHFAAPHRRDALHHDLTLLLGAER